MRFKTSQRYLYISIYLKYNNSNIYCFRVSHGRIFLSECTTRFRLSIQSEEPWVSLGPTLVDASKIFLFFCIVHFMNSDGSFQTGRESKDYKRVIKGRESVSGSKIIILYMGCGLITLPFRPELIRDDQSTAREKIYFLFHAVFRIYIN